MRLWAKGQARGKGKDGAGSLSLRDGTGGTGSTPKDRGSSWMCCEGKRGSLLFSLEAAGPSLRKSSGLIYTFCFQSRGGKTTRNPREANKEKVTAMAEPPPTQRHK